MRRKNDNEESSIILSTIKAIYLTDPSERGIRLVCCGSKICTLTGRNNRRAHSYRPTTDRVRLKMVCV